MRCGWKILSLLALTSALLLTSGCQTDSRKQLLMTGKSQVELRSFQSRTFDTGDKDRTLRTVIATLQDLSFVVDKADAVLGTVTATKLDQTTASLPYQLRMTITVRPKGQSQMLVRANATYNITPVEDPEPYQQFFTSLSKSMFLEANTTGGPDYPAPSRPPRTASAAASKPVATFTSSEARTAWYNEARNKLEHKYERLLGSERKQRYSLGCDKNPKQARTEACQDVSFQIQLLEEAKEKSLSSLSRQFRSARVQTSRKENTVSGPIKTASTINFGSERPMIKQAIINFLDISGGGENCWTEITSSPHEPCRLDHLNHVTLKDVSGEKVVVVGQYTIAAGAERRSFKSKFTLQKRGKSFQVLEMRPI